MTLLSLLFFLPLLGSVSAIDLCPVLGAQYPAPLDLANDVNFHEAISSLHKNITDQSKSGAWNGSTFSIGAFSTRKFNATSSTVYQFHRLDASAGNVTVDANSVYRVGSMTKLLTVYLWLISQGEQSLLNPITKYLPELSTPVKSRGISPAWEDITIGELASQQGGLSRNYALADLTATPGVADFKYNFTDLQPPVCNFLLPDGSFKPCSQPQLIDGIKSMSAFFPASYTPAYSNDGFALIAMALQRVTNSTMADLYQKSLITPLGLNGTTSATPASTANDIIPVNATISGWNADLGAWAPAGGSFSSLNDFVKIGQSILDSELLPKGTTSRWLKPKTFFEFFGGAIGMPWEISRVKTDNHSVDLYAKGGDYQAYHGAIVLVPDYDFGLVVLTANDAFNASTRNKLQELASQFLIPGAIHAAKNQTARRFAGTYKSQSVNSSVTFAIDDLPAMKVSSWLVQGVDVITNSPSYAGSAVEMRLIPSMLSKDQNQTVDFMGSTQLPGHDPEPATAGSYNNDMNKCISWATMGGVTVGGVALEQWRFTLDKEGNAVEAESLALGVKYQRQK